MTVKGDVGATKERLGKSKMRPIITELTAGGFIESVSHVDLQHCYLDTLLNENLLGPEECARIRYDSGYRLRALYFEFHSSGTCCIKEAGSFDPHQFTSDGETDADRAEARFHKTLTALPAQYRRIVRFVCLEDVMGQSNEPAYYEFIREALDALCIALKISVAVKKKV